MANRKNTLLLKRSNVAGKIPASGDLLLGELAINTADAILYASGTTSNTILPIGWDRVSRTGDTINGNLTITGNTNISGSTNISGDLYAKTLVSTQSIGDEGGEIKLATPQTNTSLSSASIIFDVYQNKLRFFEGGGSNRGVYIDLTATAAGVGTNLLSGGGGEVNTASNLGSGTGLFAQKVAADLQFKSLTSTGGTVTISNDSTIVNLEANISSTFTGGTVSGGTVFLNGVTANTISNVDYINFKTSPSVPNPTGGTLYFDSNENALSYKPLTNQNDVTVNLGQESLIRIYNNLGYQINNGQVLHITGSTGGIPTVALANASKLGATFTESLAQTSGVATHDIPSGQYGFMTNFGVVRDLNTTAFTTGQEVFLSDTVDGGLTNDPNNIAFTSRISTVGYCLESNATTGKILVVITNENPLQSLTQQEINVLLGNTISTGAYFYTGATTASTTTVNVSPMRGWIVYNTGPIYSINPLVLNIYYSGGTNLPVTGLTSSFDTYLLVNSGGTLYQTNSFPSPQERRQNIFLGRVVHPNKTTILNVEQSVDYDVSPLSSLRDLWVPIKIINEGVVPSPNGATLTFKTSSGTFWGNGIGFPTNELNPNAITVPAYEPASFYYTTQSGGTFTATTTTVDTLNYDVNGVITNVPGSGNYTTQRIYMSQSGVIRLQYGQNFYSTLAKAIADIPSETFVVNPDNSSDCTLIGLLTVKDGISDLSNVDDAVFTFVSKFGEILGGTAGISTTTLQQAYNNSVNPEIVTNTTLGAVQFKGGTGSDTAANIIVENNAGSQTGYWLANGGLLASNLTATTISATTLTTPSFTANTNGLVVSTVNGVYVSPYVTIGAAYTATTANSTIEISGGTFTLTLYTAVGNSGRTIYIKNSGSGIVTVDANASETIDGQLTRPLGTFEDLLLQSNGANWVILNRKPVVMQFSHDSQSVVTPADSTTYYIGNFVMADPATTSGATRQVIALSSGWVRSATLMISVAGTLATSGNSTFSLKNVTTGADSIISSTVAHTSAAQLLSFTLATPMLVTKGDLLQINWRTPTWTTNPSSVRQALTILVE
jgi:hypothetical protein